MDVFRPLPDKDTSTGGCKYLATLYDDYFKFSVVMPLRSKGDVTPTSIDVIKWLEKQCGCQLKAIRTDKGSEYVNQRFRSFPHDKGVEHQRSAPYTPEQNGAAERLNRTISELTRAMLPAKPGTDSGGTSKDTVGALLWYQAGRRSPARFRLQGVCTHTGGQAGQAGPARRRRQHGRLLPRHPGYRISKQRKNLSLPRCTSSRQHGRCIRTAASMQRQLAK
jgi:transposase InsO family protein